MPGLATIVPRPPLSALDFTTQQELPTDKRPPLLYQMCHLNLADGTQAMETQESTLVSSHYATGRLEPNPSHCQSNLHDANQDPNLQALVTNVTAEQVMTKPIYKLHQWITNSTNHIRNHHKAAQLHAKLKTRDIRQYFTKLQPKTISNSTAKNLLRPP